MKKIVFLCLLLFIIVGCSNENSLIKNDYISNHSYTEIYSDLMKFSNEVSYFPTKKAERNFYELIEVIRDNHDKFSSEELNNLISYYFDSME